MSIMGSPGSEDRKKFYAVCAFVVVAAVYLYFQYFRDSGTTYTPPAPVVVTSPTGFHGASPADESSTAGAAAAPAGKAAKLVGTTSAAYDPTLHMESMLVTESVTYEGAGRNIFSASSAPPPVVIQKAVAPARPNPVITQVAPPRPPAPQTCPPQCPPIDLKFIGTLEIPPGSGNRQAFLLHGEDVSVASPGDIVMRRYRIISISANSIEVEDIPNNNKQSLPFLAAN